MKKFQMVERPLRRPKWRVASRQWDLAGMTMTLLDRRRRLGQPRRNAHRPAGERISQGGRRGTWVLCRGPSGTAALGMCAAFAGPGGRRGARDTGSRETWGLSRLWCIPAVVAYVVCMYRIRARLFATPTLTVIGYGFMSGTVTGTLSLIQYNSGPPGPYSTRTRNRPKATSNVVTALGIPNVPTHTVPRLSPTGWSTRRSVWGARPGGRGNLRNRNRRHVACLARTMVNSRHKNFTCDARY